MTGSARLDRYRYGGDSLQGRYHILRLHPLSATSDGREVDFVVVEGRNPILFVEAKRGDQDVDRGLKYLKARFPKVDAWQLSETGTKDYVTPDGIRVAPALTFLPDLV